MANKQEMIKFWNNIDFDKISDLKRLKSETVNTTFAINVHLLEHFKNDCKNKGITCTDVYLKAIIKSIKS